MGRPLGSKNKPKMEFTFDSKKYLAEKKKQAALPAPVSSAKAEKSSKKKRLATEEDLKAVFGKDSKKIRALIESREDDNAMVLSQRKLLSMLVALIPTAEATYRGDPRQSNAIALSSLISQIRELIHDIQSTQDRARVADSIVFNILQPTMVAFANFVIDNNHQTKRDLLELVDVRQKRELDALMNRQAKAIGSYMQTMMDDLKERITKELSE